MEEVIGHVADIRENIANAKADLYRATAGRSQQGMTAAMQKISSYVSYETGDCSLITCKGN